MKRLLSRLLSRILNKNGCWHENAVSIYGDEALARGYRARCPKCKATFNTPKTLRVRIEGDKK